MELFGYSERGLINSLFFELGSSKSSKWLLCKFLTLVKFPNKRVRFKIKNNPIVIIEQCFSDFGDADALLLIDNNGSKQAIFIEAKVKTFHKEKWSIEDEFNDFKKGTLGEVNSSNLFMQLYLKQRLINALQKYEFKKIQKEGVIFPKWSSKNPRKLGENKVVERAAKHLKKFSQSAYFVALVPEEPERVNDFFYKYLKAPVFLGAGCCELKNWGFIFWADIEKFSERYDLKMTKKIFTYNEGQIY